MAKYVRPRLVVEAVKLAPEIAQKLGFSEGAYLVNGSSGSQYVQGVNAFENEFRLVTRTVPTPRPTRMPRPRKSRARKALGRSPLAEGQALASQGEQS